MNSANERWHYNVMSPLIIWEHTQNDPYISIFLYLWCKFTSDCDKQIDLIYYVCDMHLYGDKNLCYEPELTSG